MAHLGLQAVRTFAVCIAMLAFGATGHAQSPLRLLPPELFTVSDESGVLSADEGQRLAVALREINDQTGVPVVVVIAETTQPEPIRDYAERLGQRWRDEKGIDPALMVFVIASMRDREMQVLPGRALGFAEALQSEDPSALVGPYFRQQRYFDGLMVLVTHVRELLGKRPSASGR